MLIRNSISTTKKFFQNTLNNFKSLFSGSSYERIPKTSPYNTYQYMNDRELEKFYSEFTDRWDKEKENKEKKNMKKITSPPKQGLIIKNQSYEIERRRKREKLKYSSNGEEEISRKEIAEKLKEIEMMDRSNVDHVLDIEEVLHYYSRLTCPAYLHIVDKFFTDLYAECFDETTTPPSVNSRPIRISSLRS